MRKLTITIAALLTSLLIAPPLQANERHLTYTYESATLPAGATELEAWVTNRTGRQQRYNRFDNRLELEHGITDRLLTAFYLNTSATIAGTGDTSTRSFEFEGVSSEWKYKLSDSSADALGSALYFEVGYGLDELELEAKVILDKRLDKVLLATNLVFEVEVEELGDRNVPEVIFESDLAAAYFLSERLSLGLEQRTHAEIADGNFEHVSFFAGPVVAWSSRNVWMAATFLAQVGSISHAHDHSFARTLDEHEKFEGRLLLGMHF
jgi:hypothetical protein